MAVSRSPLPIGLGALRPISPASGQGPDSGAIYIEFLKMGNTIQQICRTPSTSFVKGFIKFLNRTEITLDVNTPDSNGETPLFVAAQMGRKEVVEYLIGKGAEINTPDSKGDTPLHVAVQNDWKEIINLLLRHRANVNQANTKDVTPLYSAIKSRCWEIVELFINHLGDINASDEKGNTALHYAASLGWMQGVDLLISIGADINKANGAGQTPLHFASYYGRPIIVKDLIEKGADISLKNIGDSTALHLSCMALEKVFNARAYKMRSSKMKRLKRVVLLLQRDHLPEPRLRRIISTLFMRILEENNESFHIWNKKYLLIKAHLNVYPK